MHGEYLGNTSEIKTTPYIYRVKNTVHRLPKQSIIKMCSLSALGTFDALSCIFAFR